jgi:hypothetical protein
VFYNAHFASTTIDVDVPIIGGRSTVNLIASSPELSPVVYVIPPAMLLTAGLAAVRATGATDRAEALRQIKRERELASMDAALDHVLEEVDAGA